MGQAVAFLRDHTKTAVADLGSVSPAQGTSSNKGERSKISHRKAHNCQSLLHSAHVCLIRKKALPCWVRHMASRNRGFDLVENRNQILHFLFKPSNGCPWPLAKTLATSPHMS